MKYKNVFFSFVVVFILMGCGNALAHPPSTVVYVYEDDDCYDHHCHDYHDLYYGNTVVVPAPRRHTVVHRHHHIHHHRYHKRSRAQRIVRNKRSHKRYRSQHRPRVRKVTRTRTQWQYR